MIPRMGRRRLQLAAVAALLALAVACCGGSQARPHASGGGTAPAPPLPNEPLPHDPARLAARLAQVTDALNSSIDRWNRQGNPSAAAPPTDVTLEALYTQRVYRLLAQRPSLAAATLRRLPARLRSGARDTTTALSDLFHLTPPTHKRRFRTGPPAAAGALLRYYRAGQRRFRIAWNVLAAVNFVESAFGRFRNSSSAGAQGPMQFLPSTWRVYGLGGDIHDPHDAILGAANYLHRSGAPGSYTHALFAYNPSRLYVDAVLRYARRMARDRHAYFAYYSWQVFVRTPSGEKRITGPR
jgi:membrane-bound lytic murein transglycosylase B